MSLRKLPLFMMALLLSLCSNTYAYYMNTVNIYATGSPGTDTTGWVNSLGTKVDNALTVSSTNLQRGWAVMKPNLVLPVGAVMASVDLVFNITNVVAPAAGTYMVTINNLDASQYAGPALYNTLFPATIVSSASWGTNVGTVTLPLSTVQMATYLPVSSITLGFIETSGTGIYTISGETSGALAPHLVVKYYTPCTGTPTGGTASSTAANICPNTPFTLSDVGYTVDTGITYQWQYNTGAGWNDSGTATNPTSFPISAQTVTTQYRLKVTCTFNGNIGYSNVVTVTENPPTSCYCIPNPGSGGCGSGDGINTFILTGENASAITDFGTGCHANAYDDRTIETVQLMQCVSYGAIITKITNNGQQDNVNIWIDFNDDGIFSASESVATATNITNNYPIPNNITINIPTGATTGNHRMRVMVGRGVAPASFDPCNAGPVWNYGETHDYTANILPIIVLNTPIIAGNTDVCVGSCVTLTANVANANAGTKYIWTYPPTFAPVITTNPNLDVCNAAMTNTGTYTVKAFYGCDTTAVGTANVTIHAQPQATPSSNSPVCSGTTLNLNGTPIDPITGWEWLGPVAYDQVGQNQTRTNMLTTYAGTYSMIVTDAFGCKDTFTTNVSVLQTPTLTLTPTNPSTCVPGNEGQIKVSGLTTGTTYDVFWNGPMNGNMTATATAGAITISNLIAGSYTVYVLTQTVPVCQTPNVVTVLSNPVYNISLSGLTNPTTCTPGNDGSIKIGGLTTGQGYELFWTDPLNVIHDSSATSAIAIGGALTINGLIAGSYTNIYIVKDGCTSNIIGPVILVNPSYGITNVGSTNPTNCVPGCDGTITISGLTANIANQWNVYYLFNGNPMSALNRSTNGSGQITLSNMCEGNYTNIYVVRNGCTTNTWAGPIVLVNPSYTLSGVTTTNPTTCGNSGCFKICGLPPSTGGFVITYLDPSNNVVNTGAVASDASGCISVCSLPAGTYDNIYATKGGCITNSVGPVTLTNPANPAATAGSNSPICSGNNLNLTGGPAAGVSWAWTGPTGFNVTGVQSPTRTAVATVDAGTYKIVVTDLTTGCKDSATTNVVINKTPTLTSLSSTNPTKCGTCNGSFTISGLDPNTSYTLHYLKNAVLQFPVNFTSTATGTYTRSGLCLGVYDNIYVTSAFPASCPSNALGPVTLTEPPAPAQPGASSNSPVCAGDSLKLDAVSATYGATYKWSGPAAFGNNIPGQNQVVPNVTAAYGGNYSVTVKDTFNCTSLPTVIGVTINPLPVITVSSNTPVCVGGTLELYSTSDIAGSTVLWTYPDGPTSTLDSPTRSNAITLYGGEYTVEFTSPAGCHSKDSTQVFIGNILLAGLQASNNGPLCTGDTLKLDAGVLVPGAQYSWVGPNGYYTPIADPILTNVQLADSGDYIVSAILNGCLSAPDTTHVVIRPTTTASISITVDPSDTICLGDNVTFTATIINGGDDPQYQWVKNGFWVLGATDSFWGSPSLYNNDSIFCILTSNQVCVTNPVDTSNGVHITLGTQIAPSVVLTANPSVILPGQPIDFTATAVNAGPNPTFEWFRDGVLIPNVTGNTYTGYNLTANDQIKVVVHSSFTCALTDTASAFWGNPDITLHTTSVTGQETAITLYPNPNNGTFAVKGIFQGIASQDNIPIEVINALGQVVYSDKTNITNNVMEIKFNLVDMPGGMYVLKLGTGDEAHILRFMIN